MIWTFNTSLFAMIESKNWGYWDKRVEMNESGLLLSSRGTWIESSIPDTELFLLRCFDELQAITIRLVTIGIMVLRNDEYIIFKDKRYGLVKFLKLRQKKLFLVIEFNLKKLSLPLLKKSWKPCQPYVEAGGMHQPDTIRADSFQGCQTAFHHGSILQICWA